MDSMKISQNIKNKSSNPSYKYVPKGNELILRRDTSPLMPISVPSTIAKCPLINKLNF